MPRIPRHLIKEKDRCYHIISRTTGQEFSLGDLEKEYLMQRIKKLSSVYFVKVFTFCILSNHFHLLIRMESGEDCSDEEIKRRYRLYYGSKYRFPTEKANHFRDKWSDLSEYVKEIKQGFSSWYNRLNNRKGYFWSERFKSVVVEQGSALLSCGTYIDLNPVRAKISQRPEDYRYCGLGYHVQSGNKGGFLSLGFLDSLSLEESSLASYRRYVDAVVSPERSGCNDSTLNKFTEKEINASYQMSRVLIFRYRSRYFTESVVLGSRVFVKRICMRLQPYLKAKKKRKPTKIHELMGLYSLSQPRQSNPLQ